MNLSLRRIARLARWNAVLLSRNRLTFVYVAVLPLMPLVLMVGASEARRPSGRTRAAPCS